MVARRHRPRRVVPYFALCAAAFACTPSTAPDAKAAATSTPATQMSSDASAAPVTDAGARETSKPSTNAPPAAPQATTALALRREGRVIAIAALKAPEYNDAVLDPAADGSLLLDTRFDDFVVLDAKTKKVVLREKGYGARWVSPTEVAFFGKETVSKVDVMSKKRDSRPATFNERDSALFISPDLAHAVRGHFMRGPLDNSGGKDIPLFASDDPQRGSIAQAFMKKGAACAMTALVPFGMTKLDSSGSGDDRRGAIEIVCAEPPWSSPRKIAELGSSAPLEPGAGRVQFVSDRELLASIPEAREGSLFRHCLVARDTGAARCTGEARPAWQLAGDERHALQTNDGRGEPLLIDLVALREWPLSDGTHGAWQRVDRDRRDPKRVVLQRHDKHIPPYGIVTLPEP